MRLHTNKEKKYAETGNAGHPERKRAGRVGADHQASSSFTTAGPSRARIVLAAAQGHSNAQIAHELAKSARYGSLWRDRWVKLQGIDQETLSVAARLQDAPRPGAPARMTVEQRCQIAALACEAPMKAGRPIKKSDRARNRRRIEEAKHRSPDLASTCLLSARNMGTPTAPLPVLVDSSHRRATGRENH